MKSLFLILCSCVCLWRFAIAQADSLNSEIQKVLGASNKSFNDFALITLTTKLPALPAPRVDSPNQRMAQLRNVLCKRISGVKWKIDVSNKNESLNTLSILCRLRTWLLRETGYTNTVLASYIEENVAMAVLSALETGGLSVAEAKKLSAELMPRTSTNVILLAVQSSVAGSDAITRFKRAIAMNETGSLLGLADDLSKERAELPDGRLSSLLTDVRPASLVLNAAETALTSYLTVCLIDYASKGGDIHLEDKAFRADLAQRMPEIIGIIEPVSRIKLEASMFAAVIENAREWTSKH